MIKRASSIVLILMLCTGCAQNDSPPLDYLARLWFVATFDPARLQGPQTTGWALHIHRQCEASTSEISDEDCLRLLHCMGEVGRSIFDPPSPENLVIINRTYNRIVPFDTDEIFPLYSMSFLRERAEKAGPRAVALFAEMEDARNVCLAETGLTERIGYN